MIVAGQGKHGGGRAAPDGSVGPPARGRRAPWRRARLRGPLRAVSPPDRRLRARHGQGPAARRGHHAGGLLLRPCAACGRPSGRSTSSPGCTRSRATRRSTPTAASARTAEVSYDAEGGLAPDDRIRLVASEPGPVEAIGAKEEIEHLTGAFGGLSETHHEILVLRELEGRSYADIGERLGMSRGAVESTLFRARKRLGEEYEELASGRRCERVQTRHHRGRGPAPRRARPAQARPSPGALPVVPAPGRAHRCRDPGGAAQACGRQAPQPPPRPGLDRRAAGTAARWCSSTPAAASRSSTPGAGRSPRWSRWRSRARAWASSRPGRTPKDAARGVRGPGALVPAGSGGAAGHGAGPGRRSCAAVACRGGPSRARREAARVRGATNRRARRQRRRRAAGPPRGRRLPRRSLPPVRPAAPPPRPRRSWPRPPPGDPRPHRRRRPARSASAGGAGAGARRRPRGRDGRRRRAAAAGRRSRTSLRAPARPSPRRSTPVGDVVAGATEAVTEPLGPVGETVSGVASRRGAGAVGSARSGGWDGLGRPDGARVDGAPLGPVAAWSGVTERGDGSARSRSAAS